MATVRFSNDLNTDIIRAARSKMKPAIDRAREQVLDAAWGQKIYDTLFASALPVLSQLPSYWFKTTETVSVDYFGTSAFSYSWTIPKQPWPVGKFDNDFVKQTVHYRDHLTLLPSPVWDDLFTEVAAYRERVAAATRRSEEFEQMVQSVIRAHSTLGPALKMWPPLWDLIPEATKERHRKVVERVKGPVEVDVDLNKLTAMATAAKFGL